LKKETAEKVGLKEDVASWNTQRLGGAGQIGLKGSPRQNQKKGNGIDVKAESFQTLYSPATGGKAKGGRTQKQNRKEPYSYRLEGEKEEG